MKKLLKLIVASVFSACLPFSFAGCSNLLQETCIDNGESDVNCEENGRFIYDSNGSQKAGTESTGNTTISIIVSGN